MFPRDEAWKHRYPAGLDCQIVIAAAEWPPAVFQNSQAPPFGTVHRGEFLELDNPVHNAVRRFVGDIRGAIVNQQNSGGMTGEVVFEGKKLPPISE